MRAMFDYYNGRRGLITGHTGLKGSWLTHWLKSLGAEVCGIALAPDTAPSMFELIHGADDISSQQFDISDRGAVQRVFQVFQPKIVFHLAAQSLVRRSYERPLGHAV
jgi:CDP-glucose 4,6-dehydratase